MNDKEILIKDIEKYIKSMEVYREEISNNYKMHPELTSEERKDRQYIVGESNRPIHLLERVLRALK
ncbi:MAG: hypothetical protein IIA87_03595 [Nanoarchaeota archaeon]|nr:hypothetical protein [Nanoarchaeota archaeon]